MLISCFLHLFLWERFKTLSRKPTQYDVVEMVEVEENVAVVERPDRRYQLTAQRWSDVKQNKHRKLWKVIDIEKNFNFRPYTFTPRGVV